MAESHDGGFGVPSSETIREWKRQRQAVISALDRESQRLSEEQFATAKQSLTDEEQDADRRQAEALREEARTLKLRNDDLQQNSELRKRLANRTHLIVVGWMSCMAVVVFLQGASWPSSFRFAGLVWDVPVFVLSDSVMIAMLTTTTINIIGLLLTITLNLFPPRRKD